MIKKLQPFSFWGIVLVLLYTDSFTAFLYNSSLNATTGFLPKSLSVLLYATQLVITFPLLSLTINLNKDHLENLNIDTYYLILFFMSGAIGLVFIPLTFFHAVTLFICLHLLFSKKIIYSVDPNNTLRIFLVIGILISVYFVILYRSSPINLGIDEVLRYHIFEVIPGAVFEEFLFRGALFGVLTIFGIDGKKIFFIQAFLFWLVHISYVDLLPLFFWIKLPIISLILGYIAQKTKTLTLSSIAHIVINILLQM